MSLVVTCGINSPFGELSPTSRQIPHVLRTLSPLNYSSLAGEVIPFDLHVLSTPPAFVLSQNQTLREKFVPTLLRCRQKSDHSYLRIAEAVRRVCPILNI